MGTNWTSTATHLELYGYQLDQYCHPLGIVWVPTGPVLPPTWNCMGTNRTNTGTHLELCGYQPYLYFRPVGILWVPTVSILPPTWNYVGTNRIYTAAHLELYGYQPDPYCRVHNQSPPWKQMDPHGALGTPASVGPPTIQKAPKALSKDLPKSLLV
jgi:hypothetical protein